MILLLRALARLLTFLLLLALALAGLALAVIAISGGDPGLTSSIGLPSVRDSVGNFLSDLEGGDKQIAAVLGGLAAILLGLLLLIGLLAPRRERLVVFEKGDEGTITARRRPLAQMATTLAERTSGVTSARAKVKPSRRGDGGQLRLTASHPRSTPADEVTESTGQALEPLSALGLSPRVRTQVGDRGERVQ